MSLETFKAESIPIARGSQDGIPHPTHASFYLQSEKVFLMARGYKCSVWEEKRPQLCTYWKYFCIQLINFEMWTQRVVLRNNREIPCALTLTPEGNMLYSKILHSECSHSCDTKYHTVVTLSITQL